MTNATDTITLADGHELPRLGLGVYKLTDTQAATVVEAAIETGYRHVDTAALYGNERGVGDGVRASGIDRSELFITTKVWNDDHGYDETLRAFDVSAAKLDLDWVDLYLIHWPQPRLDRYMESWRALQTLLADGRVRSIGVSNFTIDHLERVIGESGVTPVLNQVELHPLLQQRELREFHARHGIVTESWSPLARGQVLDRPELVAIAEKHGASVAQAVIAWHLQLGVSVIPKSQSPARVAENFAATAIRLDAADLEVFETLEAGYRTGIDPALS